MYEKLAPSTIAKEYIIDHTPPVHFRDTQQRPVVRMICQSRADATTSFFNYIVARLGTDPKFCGNLTLYSAEAGSIISSVHIDGLGLGEIVTI